MAQIRKQLRKDESEVLHAYQDHLGYWTIGIGRLIDKRRGGGITKEESAYLLENDITTRLNELEQKLPWFSKLNEARQGALLNMSFQLGVPGLMNFKRTLELIEAGDYDAAADRMMLSLWARQTPKRAKRISEQMRTGKWYGQK
jgi:lysozyme